MAQTSYKPTQGQIDNYVMGALNFMPTLDKEQLIAMAMLHFDNFYDDTKPMIEQALKSIHRKGENNETIHRCDII